MRASSFVNVRVFVELPDCQTECAQGSLLFREKQVAAATQRQSKSPPITRILVSGPGKAVPCSSNAQPAVTWDASSLIGTLDKIDAFGMRAVSQPTSTASSSAC
jgi:hypothetical protein